MLQSTYKWLRMIINVNGANCLVGPEVMMVHLGDEILWSVESNDMPLNC